MYPFYFGPAPGRRRPHEDDIGTLGPLSGADVPGTTGTDHRHDPRLRTARRRLTGVNVIARNVADPFNDAVSAISSDFTNGYSQAVGARRHVYTLAA